MAAMIFAFLRGLSARAIAAASIPVSVFGPLTAMRLLGCSIDMFSMMDATLSVGLLVDDAI